MGTLKPGSHHEVLRSVCPRLCGPGPPRRGRGCGGSPRLRTSLWRCCWVCSALRRPTHRLAHAPVVYNPLESGLVYPVAEAYVHDATGDEAEAYVHDVTGDA